jgi:hypothetical protein
MSNGPYEGSLMSVSKPSQDKGHSPAAKYARTYHCKHEHCIRKLLEFSDLDRSALPLPFTHQVSFCTDCWQIVGQEDNRERRAMVVAFKKETGI